MRHVLVSIGCWEIYQSDPGVYTLKSSALDVEQILDVYDLRDLGDTLKEFGVVCANIEETE